tara:strand:- start:274 stop:570 length:297 start_codon:yes stop_codon:yes gene_type:complete
MVLPLLLPLALIASSAIMVAPYANEEIKKSQVAKEIDHLGADIRDQQQSERLKITMGNADNTQLPINPIKNPSITSQSWFVPMLFAAGAFLLFVVLRK